MVFLKDQFLVTHCFTFSFKDFPKVLQVIHNALLILFAVGTSVIVTDSNIVDYQSNIKVIFEQLNIWFVVNLLLLLLLLLNVWKNNLSSILKQRMLMR
jgi:hypothetical protein